MADTKISGLPASTTPLAGTEVLPVVQSGATKQVSVSNLTAGRDVSVLNLAATQTVGTSLGSGGIYFSGDSGPDVSFVGYNYKNISGTESTPVAARASWREGFLNGAPIEWNVSYRAASAAANSWTKYFVISSAGDLTFSVGNLVQGTAAKGVNFTANTPAAGMTSQLLNWYEEGTWTPTDASGGSLTFTGTSGNCYYTRTGNLVTCVFSITYPTTANVNSARVTGLPFTSKSSTNAIAGGQLSFTNYGSFLSMTIDTGGNSFYFWTSAGALVTNATCSGKTFRGVIQYMV